MKPRLKNIRYIYKINWSLLTKVDKPKTSCKYSETKKLKQVHSVIPNLKHKLLASESTIRKSTYKKKQIKTEKLLNQTFSPEISKLKTIKTSVLYGLPVEKFHILLTCLLYYLIPKTYGQWDWHHW